VNRAIIMTDLMLRDIPNGLYVWLEQRAQANHRSLPQEALALLESLPRDPRSQPAKPTVKEIMAIVRRFAELPELDRRNPNEVLGYDQSGLPMAY
jgi:plasmid stability protein